MIAINLIVVVGAVIWFAIGDQRPEIVDEQGNERPATFKEWMQTDPDDYDREPLDDKSD